MPDQGGVVASQQQADIAAVAVPNDIHSTQIQLFQKRGLSSAI